LFRSSALSLVHAASMTDPYDKNAQCGVFDRRDDAVVPDAVLPELAEFRSFQRRTDAARIIECGNAVGQEPDDAPRGFLPELVQFLRGGRIEINPPGHAPSSRRQAAPSRCGRSGCPPDAVRRDRCLPDHRCVRGSLLAHRTSWYALSRARAPQGVV